MKCYIEVKYFRWLKLINELTFRKQLQIRHNNVDKVRASPAVLIIQAQGMISLDQLT